MTGTSGTLCGLAYPFQRGYAPSQGGALSPPGGEIFDEIYFGVFAHDDLKGIAYFDPEPPLAKLIIAGGEWSYGWWRHNIDGVPGDPADLGFNPFGWRIMSCIFGTLIVPLIYLFALRLWRNRLFAVSAAVLVCFDGMFFIQSRIGMIDIFAVFFILLAYYMFQVHLDSRGPRDSLVTLLLTGVTVGLAVSAKWIAIAAVSVMVFVLLMRIVRRLVTIRIRTGDTSAWVWGREEAVGPALPGGAWWLAYLAGFALAFVAIPVSIYLASWMPFFARGQFHGLGDLWKYQVDSYSYHAHLTATHPYGSPWYSWPFLYRPVAYYFENAGLGVDVGRGQLLVAGMVNLGNPWIWWTAIPCVVLMPYFALKQRNYAAALITMGFITQYLPWSVISRVIFLYHMFAGLPFMILALAFCLAKLAQAVADVEIGPFRIPGLGGAALLYAHLALAILFFIFFYPVWTGIPIGADQYLGGFGHGRMWFAKWI